MDDIARSRAGRAAGAALLGMVGIGLGYAWSRGQAAPGTPWSVVALGLLGLSLLLRPAIQGVAGPASWVLAILAGLAWLVAGFVGT